MEQDLLELNRFKTVLDKDSNNLSVKADEAIKHYKDQVEIL